MGILKLGKGKLSYTLAAIAIAWGLAGWVFFDLGSMEAMTVIWAGLSVFGIRRAVE